MKIESPVNRHKDEPKEKKRGGFRWLIFLTPRTTTSAVSNQFKVFKFGHLLSIRLNIPNAIQLHHAIRTSLLTKYLFEV